MFLLLVVKYYFPNFDRTFVHHTGITINRLIERYSTLHMSHYMPIEYTNCQQSLYCGYIALKHLIMILSISPYPVNLPSSTIILKVDRASNIAR